MVEVTLSSRAKNFVPLALMRLIAASTDAPNEVSYIGGEGVQAIKGKRVCSTEIIKFCTNHCMYQ